MGILKLSIEILFTNYKNLSKIIEPNYRWYCKRGPNTHRNKFITGGPARYWRAMFTQQRLNNLQKNLEDVYKFAQNLEILEKFLVKFKQFLKKFEKFLLILIIF